MLQKRRKQLNKLGKRNQRVKLVVSLNVHEKARDPTGVSKISFKKAARQEAVS